MHKRKQRRLRNQIKNMLIWFLVIWLIWFVWHTDLETEKLESQMIYSYQ